MGHKVASALPNEQGLFLENKSQQKQQQQKIPFVSLNSKTILSLKLEVEFCVPNFHGAFSCIKKKIISLVTKTKID